MRPTTNHILFAKIIHGPPLMYLLLLHCRFIDIGAGLGKPNLHVAQDPCCRLSLGIELETIRWQVHSVMYIYIFKALESVLSACIMPLTDTDSYLIDEQYYLHI